MIQVTKEMFDEMLSARVNLGYAEITLSVNGKGAKYAVDAMQHSPRLTFSGYEDEYSVGLTKLREVDK